MTIKVNGIFPGELKPTQTIAGCVDVFEGAWPDPNEVIDRIELEVINPDSGAHWEAASTIGQGTNQKIRTNKVMHVSHLADTYNNLILQNIHNQFYIMLLAATIPYAERMGIKESLWHESYQILKYSPGEFYGQHYDGWSSTGRSISAICYLNDDYEGGEIDFIHHGVKIKPTAGTLILFPSNFAYSHVAHPVTSGTKYAVVTWIKDRQVD